LRKFQGKRTLRAVKSGFFLESKGHCVRIYLDSNVFISLIDREVGKGSRGLFVEAEQFLERVKETGGVLVLSSWFFKEVHSFNFMEKEVVLGYFRGQGAKTETLPEEKKSLLMSPNLADCILPMRFMRQSLWPQNATAL
jgi:hypothetical protein